MGVCALLMAPSVWAATPAMGQGGGMLPAAVGPAGLGGRGAGPGVRGGPGGGFGFGGRGGVNQQVIDYLEANRGSDTFLVATSNSNAAAPIILATVKPVMSLGGFLGSDPIVDTQQFQTLVQDGVVRFVMAGGGFGRGNTSVMGWVQQNCAPVSVSGAQLYDCGA